MKRSWKLASSWCLTLFSVLLLTAAARTISVSAAGDPAGQKSGQVVAKPLLTTPIQHPVAAAAQLQPKPNVMVQLTPPRPSPVTPPQAGAPVPRAACGNLPALLRQLAAGTAQKHSAEAEKKPVEVSAIVKKTCELLAAPRFTFLPNKAVDPFVPFVSLQPTNESGGPGAGTFLTPLQKMTLTEMETGLKAIASGGLGKMAVIEDSTGKGYIVGVGTPAGPNDGVITQINDNDLVVREAVWNSQTRERVAKDFTVKMVKKSDQPF